MSLLVLFGGGVAAAAWLAFKQARFNVARFGASRFNWFIPNLVATIAGVDRSASIIINSLRITLNMNDEPDTAFFTLKPQAALAPTVNQEVVLGLGTAANREFGGQIIRARRRRRHAAALPFVDVECIDWTRLFDRRLITHYYANQSASAIVRDIVSLYTSGFTANSVEDDLPVIEFLPVTMDPPSVTLRKLARLLGGAAGFRIDANKDVHFWGAGGESGSRQQTPPTTLTNLLDSLKSFSDEHDASQIRTRVYTEAKGSQTLADVAEGMSAIPLQDANAFINGGGGALIEEYGGFAYGTRNVFAHGTTTTGAVSIGATSLPIANLTMIVGVGFYPGWLLIGGRQYVYYTDGSVTSFPAGNVTGIPSSGPGSITSAIASGEDVVNVPFIGAFSFEGAGPGVTRSIPQGTYVAATVQSDDTAQQTALAALEGGDGIREHHIRDRRFHVDNAGVLGEADLDAFSNATGLLSASWETEDMNARPGVQQVIALSDLNAISATLTIKSVEMWFPKKNYPPRRYCTAGTVKLASIQDTMQASEGL